MEEVQESSFGVIPLKHQKDGWQVLVILHRKGWHWAFPKGHGHPGETPLESAERELLEETGLEVEKLLWEEPFIERYEFRRKSKVIKKTVQYFVAIVTGQVKLQFEEIQDAKWVPLKEVGRVVTFQETQKICQTLAHRMEDGKN